MFGSKKDRQDFVVNVTNKKDATIFEAINQSFNGKIPHLCRCLVSAIPPALVISVSETRCRDMCSSIVQCSPAFRRCLQWPLNVRISMKTLLKCLPGHHLNYFEFYSLHMLLHNQSTAQTKQPKPWWPHAIVDHFSLVK